MVEQDKRRRIMQAAEKLFASRSIHEITTDEVAREAKVGKGTIYNHFRDKDDMFFETAYSGVDELSSLLREKVSQKACFSEQILEACVQISEFFGRRRELFEMMQTMDKGRFCRRWQEKRRKLAGALAGIIAGGVKEGKVRQDMSPEVLAQFLLGMLRTRTRDLVDFPESARRYEVVVEIFLRGAGGQACRQTTTARP